MSALHFAIAGAKAKPYAATPTIGFGLQIQTGEAIDAMVLRAQIRIEPQWRDYSGKEKTLLNDLFGTPDRWHMTLRALSWADVPVMVPAFEQETEVEIAVPCTYDFDPPASRFLNALGGGDIPLRFLFSGAIFRHAASGFSTERVSWSSECAYRMPLEAWRAAMRACYGDDALIRISRETLEALHGVRALSGATSWDQVILEGLKRGAPL